MFDGLGNTQRPRIADVKAVVSEMAGIEPADLEAKSRKRIYAIPRQVAVMLARAECRRSYPALGIAFGRRDHTTMLFADRKIKRLASENPEVELMLNRAREKLAALVAKRAGASSEWRPTPPDAGAPLVRWVSTNKRADLTRKGEWERAA